MTFPSFKEISDKAQGAFKRFPVTLIWAILGSFFCIYLINDTSGDRFERNMDIFLTLILGISWLVGVQFYIEQRNDEKKWQGLKLVVLALLLLFYWHLPEMEYLENNPKYLGRFFLYFIAGHLFVFFAPFIAKWNKEAYWNYLKSIAFAIVRSALFSGVLYLGLVFALLAIDSLFDVYIPGERYGQLFIFCLGIVNTWIYLSDFPKNVLEDTTIHFNKALEVFVKYILIPLVMLYIIILYAYSLKILLQWELPQGWVSYMVTALAILGFVVQVIINPIQKTIKAWTINRFYPWFYILLLPLIILLFTAIFRRISDYGITENRYFVMITAFWILGISLYLLFTKGKKLKVLPITLFILALVSSFGPWSAFIVSQNSQFKQFKEVYEKVKSKNSEATYKEYDQLKSILTYLDDRKALSRLDETTEIAMENAIKDTIHAQFKTYGYLETEKILDSLGIKINSEELAKNSPNGNYFNYYGDQFGNKTYDISVFDYLSTITFNSYSDGKIETGDFDIRFDADSVALSLWTKENNMKVLQMPLKEKLLDLIKHGPDLSTIDSEEMIQEFKNDSILVKLIIADLGFHRNQDSITINHSRAYLLLKRD